jgi:hypothetical protein
MGYENVSASTLQTIIGSPPVATYDGDAVATAQGVNVGRGGSAAAVPSHTVYRGDVLAGKFIGLSTSLSQLMSLFGDNLAKMRFGAAADNLSELSRHLEAGLEHWQMFTRGYD